MVGLLFALMPVLGGRDSPGSGALRLAAVASLLARLALKLAGAVLAAAVVARSALPPLARLLAKRASAEVFQLAVLAFCFLTALLTQKQVGRRARGWPGPLPARRRMRATANPQLLTPTPNTQHTNPWSTAPQGMSGELGAFLAGVMLSATDQQEVVAAGLAPISRLFLALFISSTGLVLSPRFLAHHLPLLAAGVVVVVVAKAGLVRGGGPGPAVAAERCRLQRRCRRPSAAPAS